MHMKSFKTLIIIFALAALCGCTIFLSSPPKQSFENFKINNQIDKLVIAALKEKGIPPSRTCSDEVFIRRVYLDTTGTLPQPRDVKAFLADNDSKKRAKLIERLLAGGEFADCAAMKWADLLRIKSEFPSNLWPQAVQFYHRWVRESIYKNRPYDQFVRQLLTSTGSNFHVPPVNYYRAFQERDPKQIAENVALVFMGTRLVSPDYTEEQIQGMAAFFAKIGYKNTDEWKEEIVFFNPEGKFVDKKNNQPIKPQPLNGKPFDIPQAKDPRIVFADWLTAPNNAWFAKNAVNRIWCWLMGRGIIHEPDNISPANPPWSPELLAFLEKELIKNKYDMRHIYRLILNSNTYQLSSISDKWNEADVNGFSHYRTRRLDAEVLIDIICQVTGTTEKYTSNIPEPYTFLPDGKRAVTVADGSIVSPFLELFGKPPRNTSYESERNITPSVLQTQHMLNSSHIQRKLEQSPVIKKLMAEKKDNESVIDELYLLILSRYPTDDEKTTSGVYMVFGGKNRNEAVNDLAWALMNTKEFILKH